MCVVSAIFNIFLPAALEILLVRFSEDDIILIILKDMVYLDQERGTEIALERVRRAA